MSCLGCLALRLFSEKLERAIRVFRGFTKLSQVEQTDVCSCDFLVDIEGLFRSHFHFVKAMCRSSRVL